jgi:HJR/Mrr/RecB family endonuclease
MLCMVGFAIHALSIYGFAISSLSMFADHNTFDLARVLDTVLMRATMSRYYRHRSSNTNIIFVASLLLACLLWTHRAWVAYGLYGIALLIGLGLAVVAYRAFIAPKRRILIATLAEIDVMDGLEFERYVVDLLRRHGFERVSLTKKYDLGIDIVAEKDNERWGIQVKRNKHSVGPEAVREAVTALNAYHCSKAMVITNSTYSRYTKQLAKVSGCALIDRTGLAKLIRTSTAVSADEE